MIPFLFTVPSTLIATLGCKRRCARRRCFTRKFQLTKFPVAPLSNKPLVLINFVELGSHNTRSISKELPIPGIAKIYSHFSARLFTGGGGEHCISFSFDDKYKG